MKLNNVTLVCIDCINYNSAIKSLSKSIKNIEFERVIFFNDLIQLDCFETIIIPKIKSKEEYSQFVLKILPDYIETDFVLIIQYDGYIINPDLWTDKFINYDYIGAPWWYNDLYNVGNGGFSLRSKKLLNICKEFDFKKSHPEDDSICRFHRKEMDELGVLFAPEYLAKQFSYEPNGKYPKFENSTFGFHGLSHLILQ